MVSTVYNDKGKSKESDIVITQGQQKKTKLSLFNNKRHTRSQSSSSAIINSNNEPTIFDNNNRGWLESSSVQVNPSRSVDRKSMRQTQSTSTATRKELSQQDILGAVSDEDIRKLTEMTRLPGLNTSTSSSNNKSRRRDAHNKSSSDKQVDPMISSSDDKPITTASQSSSDNYIIEPPSSLNHTTTESPEKRRSWLYKSFIKSNKKGPNNNKQKSITPSDESSGCTSNLRSPAASIVDEFYQKNPRTSFEDTKQTRRSHLIKLKKEQHVNKHGRSHTLHPSSSVNVGSSSHSRRHSFDSSLIKENSSSTSSIQDEALNEWDQDITNRTDELETSHDGQQRPNFQLHVQSNDMNNEIHSENEMEDYLMLQKQQSYDNLAVSPSSPINTSDNEEEQVVTLMFDYNSLPTEVKGLIDAYELEGKVKHQKMIIKFRKKPSSMDNASSLIRTDDEDEDDEDDEDDDEEEIEDEDETDHTIVCYRDIIIGESSLEKVNYKANPIRHIAMLTTTLSDNIEFTKLIQLASSENQDGPLMDLRVSIFADKNDTEEKEFEDMLQSVDQKFALLESFKKDATQFLQDRIHTMQSLELFDRFSHTTNNNNYLPTLSRTHSQPSFQTSLPQSSDTTTSSSSLSATSFQDDGVVLRPSRDILAQKESRNIQSMYVGNDDVIQSSRNPFEERQDEVRRLVKILQDELHEFKSSLISTEQLVNDVQKDMDDFRTRMETYIRDIPESHYSALKKLEVDIESILSKRAKNPWLDTGYALLSYLLTLFALIVWIVIYMLKWGKRVVLFPRRLWRDYSDYLVERNKVVKKASMRSVAGGGHL